MNNDSVRVRFAPSPTGMLHIGGLRTALFNYLFARHTNGAFLLRIEDTDKERSQQRYTVAIFDTLSWCGMVPDEPLTIQSARIAEHLVVAQQLVDQGKAYRCYCTPEELQSRLGGSDYQQYDSYCKKNSIAHDRPYTIRFAIPEELTTIVIQDLIKGSIVFDRSTLDDFIIVRSDGNPVYNFVVVVDDAHMRISHVIRGEEHLINTPKQILLYQACGYTLPVFAHLPLILGPDGSKMSKRDAAANAYDYKQRGYLPAALCNYLVRLGWAHGNQEIFTWQEMIEYFSLASISQKGALFDAHKLEWVNATHIKQASHEQLYAYLTHSMGYQLETILHNWSLYQVYTAIDLFKQRSKTVRELFQQLESLHNKPVYIQAPSESEKKIVGDIQSLIAELVYDKDHLPPALKQFCATQNLTMHELAPLIRRALTGAEQAPGIVEMMLILGKPEVLARLRAYQESA